ncbi:myb-like DNA-binding domain-containing protein [Cryptosporidium serpentis]
MSSVVRDVLGISPNLKMVSLMKEKLKHDTSSLHNTKKDNNSKDLMVSIPIQAFSATNLANKKSARWKWTIFSNPARYDQLSLKHWVKMTSEDLPDIESSINLSSDDKAKTLSNREIINNSQSKILINNSASKDSTITQSNFTNDNAGQYFFSKFNKHVTVYSYQPEQYAKFIKDLDNDWTEEDTSILFNLCRDFDLRFIIIHDRYNPPSGRQRTLEQLKHRYYSVSRKLVEVNFDMKRRALGNSPDPALLTALKEERSRHPYIRFMYNFETDKNRRYFLSSSWKEVGIKKEERILLEDIQLRAQNSNNRKATQNTQAIGNLLDLGNVEDEEESVLNQIKSIGSFGMKKSGVTTAGTLCYQHTSALPRKHSSEIEGFLRHFKLDTYPLPYLDSTIAEQYVAVRCDLAILFSVRKKLQRLNSLKNAWQEKLRNATLHSDEQGISQIGEVDEKGRFTGQTTRNATYSSVGVSPSTATPRSVNYKARSKTSRIIQDANMLSPIPSSANLSTSGQTFPHSVDPLRRDTESSDKPKKRSKIHISKQHTSSETINEQIGSTQITIGQSTQTVALTVNNDGVSHYLISSESSDNFRNV